MIIAALAPKINFETNFVFSGNLLNYGLIDGIGRHRSQLGSPADILVIVMLFFGQSFRKVPGITVICGHFSLCIDGTIHQGFAIVELHGKFRLTQTLDVVEFERSLVFHVVPNELRSMGKRQFRTDAFTPPVVKITAIERDRGPF